jgi:hypothetical protein
MSATKKVPLMEVSGIQTLSTLKNAVVMNLTVIVPLEKDYTQIEAVEFCREVYEKAREQSEIHGVIAVPKGIIRIT